MTGELIVFSCYNMQWIPLITDTKAAWMDHLWAECVLPNFSEVLSPSPSDELNEAIGMAIGRVITQYKSDNWQGIRVLLNYLTQTWLEINTNSLDSRNF